jgi:exopolyphosphatase/guanosine-5'-triphosphate,3'-diphosphate pyrophosphatase
MRIAVADIGSNSTRLLIADVEDGRVTRELERRSTVTRLGAGVDAHGELSREGIERVHKTLREYTAAIDDAGANRRVAVLTSAVRDAANGREFADGVRQRFDLTPHVLSGDEEAGLTFLGAMSERDPGERTPTLVIDIGGGSTELVIGSGHEASFHVSTQAGVVRQTERHIHTDPPTPAELDALREDVRAILAHGVPEAKRDAVAQAIGVAGTATSLAAIAQRLDPYDPERVHGYRISPPECERILGQLAAIPLEERKEIPGLHPDRAPTIVAGVIIFLAALELFSLQSIEISEHDILRGAALRFSTEQTW